MFGRVTHGDAVPEPKEVQNWYLRRGLPTMLRNRKSPALIWRETLPVLVVLYLIGLLPRLLDPSNYTVVGLLLLGGALVLPWLLSNLRHGQRPFSTPRHMGRLELAMFVLFPPLYYVLSGALGMNNDMQLTEVDVIGQVILSALVFVVYVIAQLTVLLIVRIVAGFGILTLGNWLFRQLVGTLGTARTALARTLPLLLSVVTLSFFTPALWHTVGRAQGITYFLLLLVFISLSALFLASPRQLNLDALRTFTVEADVYDALVDADAPFEDLDDAIGLVGVCELDRRQRFNLRLVAVLSRLVIAVVIAACVGCVYVVLGTLAVDAYSVKTWTGSDPSVIFTFKVGPSNWLLSVQHLRVAGFLCTFAAFYFSLVSATDSAMSEGISDTADEIVRSACATRMFSERLVADQLSVDSSLGQ